MAEKNEAPEGANWDALAAEAAALDLENGPAPVEPQAAGPAQDPGAETAALLAMVVGLLSPMLPYLPGIYTEDVRGQLAAAYVALAQKHGWESGGWFERWGPEIMAAALVIPLGIRTGQEHRAWIAAKSDEAKKARELEAPKAAPEFVGPPAPGVVAGTVGFGEVRAGG